MSGRSVLLDTNTLVYLSKGLIDFDRFFSSYDDFAISIISYMELLGFNYSSESEERLVKEMLPLLTLQYIDQCICDTVISLRKKRKIKLPDAIICATALAMSMPLCSNDLMLQSIEGLTLEPVSNYLIQPL